MHSLLAMAAVWHPAMANRLCTATMSNDAGRALSGEQRGGGAGQGWRLGGRAGTGLPLPALAPLDLFAPFLSPCRARWRQPAHHLPEGGGRSTAPSGCATWHMGGRTWW